MVRSSTQRSTSNCSVRIWDWRSGRTWKSSPARSGRTPSIAGKGDRPPRRVSRIPRKRAIAGVLHGPNGTASVEDAEAALPLALLAVLAAAGEEGVPRDRLLLLFWPDASHRSARGSLDQVLETIRSWSPEPLLLGPDPLRLNASIIGSDIADFEEALAAGHPDTAVRSYGGPFLGRFRLVVSPELDAWVVEQRRRLAERRDAALEQVGRSAGEETGSSAGRLSPSRAGGSRRHGLRRRARLLWAMAAIPALLVVWPGESVPSLAVLPIRNVSGDSRYGALSDAITEELISSLGREPDRLRMISSTSVFRFRDSRSDVRSIADSLGVSSILEGTLQPADSQLRLVLRLVDGRDGSVRWTQSFEREYRDLLSGQDSIARAVADALDVRFSTPARAGPISSPAPVSDKRLAAIDLFLQGQREILFRTENGRDEARELFRRAVEVDSTYARAHAMRAHMVAESDNTGRRRRDAIATAERYARTAVALDPQFAGGYAALGHVLMLDYRFPEAGEQLERAIALDPTRSRSREFLISLYVFLDRPDLVLEQARRAVQDDPYSSTAIAELARAWLLNGRCDRALEVLDRLGSMQPPPARAAAIDAQCRAQRGSLDEAIEVLRPLADQNAVQGEPWLGFMLGRAGRQEEARPILERLLGMARRGERDAYGVAMVYAGLEELDSTFEWLDRAVDDRSLRFDIMEPAFQDLREDPRFHRLRARLELPER